MSQTIKQGNLNIYVESQQKETVLRFEGVVDEHFRFQQLPHFSAPLLHFDLAGISNFNSCGIREWIYFLRDVTLRSRVIFKNCSVAMVDQINMIAETQGKATIQSFFAPYYRTCTGCYPETETACLIDLEENADSLHSAQAPEFACDRCGKPLEFDALEESYFSFVNRSWVKAS